MNGIAFLNSLMSYLLVFIISVVGVGIAIALGIYTRKVKDAKNVSVLAADSKDTSVLDTDENEISE